MRHKRLGADDAFAGDVPAPELFAGRRVEGEDLGAGVRVVEDSVDDDGTAFLLKMPSTGGTRAARVAWIQARRSWETFLVVIWDRGEKRWLVKSWP